MAKNVLPTRFEFGHEFALFLHDTLAQIVIEGERAGLNLTSVTLKSRGHARQMKDLHGEELWEWLDAKGYKDVLHESAFRETFMALLADFCQYVFEALRASKAGKLSVTYTLLRKPFKDNLLMLEWMLVSPSEFLTRFFSQNSEHPFIIQKIPPSKKQSIIRAAADTTCMSHEEHASYLYRIRYDKKCAYGLEPVWQKAAHLVTNFTGMATDPLNFNFIYSDLDAKVSQWELIYYQVPLLLHHTVEVVEQLLGHMIEIPGGMDLSQMRRSIGFLLWTDSMAPSAETRENLLTTAADAIASLDLVCPDCRTRVNLGVRNLRRFYYHASIRCGRCKTEVQFVEVAKE